MGNIDMGKRSKLYSVKETNAFLASRTWLGSVVTYTANVARVTWKILDGNRYINPDVQ